MHRKQKGENVVVDGGMIEKMLSAVGIRLKSIECSAQDIKNLYENVGRWKVLYSGYIVILRFDNNILYVVSCGKDECSCMKFEEVKKK